MTHLEYLQVQAAACLAEADATTLANVRDRSLRSAEAWRALVEREEQSLRAKARMASNRELGLLSSD